MANEFNALDRKQKDKVLRSCLPDGTQRKTAYKTALVETLVDEYGLPMLDLLMTNDQKNLQTKYGINEDDIVRELCLILNVLNDKISQVAPYDRNKALNFIKRTDFIIKNKRKICTML